MALMKTFPLFVFLTDFRNGPLSSETLLSTKLMVQKQNGGFEALMEVRVGCVNSSFDHARWMRDGLDLERSKSRAIIAFPTSF